MPKNDDVIDVRRVVRSATIAALKERIQGAARSRINSCIDDVAKVNIDRWWQKNEQRVLQLVRLKIKEEMPGLEKEMMQALTNFVENADIRVDL